MRLHLPDKREALIFLIALACVWASLAAAAPRPRIDVGVWGDHTFLSGINAIERSTSEDYRWTTGRTQLLLPNLSGSYRLLRLRAHGWRPDGLPAPSVHLRVGDRRWGDVQTTAGMRIYHILLPFDNASPRLRIGLDSSTYTSSDDQRELGFALDWIELRAVSAPSGPALWRLGSHALLLALLLLLVRALAPTPGWALSLAAMPVSALIWANLRQPLWVSQAIEGWIGLAVGLLLTAWLLGPQVRRLLMPWMSDRQARVAWALFIAALALRLAGATHPLFNAHDVDVHMRWLTTVGGGQLYFYSTPSEFQGRPTFNPPAGYLLLLPLSLALPSLRLTVQAGVALLDALGCLLLLPLARELRLPARAGLLALALALALPINTTMLWWGFATNTIAQTVWLLLAWALLRAPSLPIGRGAMLIAALGALNLLTHIGALPLILLTIGLCLALAWAGIARAGRAMLVVGLFTALLLASTIYFTAVAPAVVGRSSGDSPALAAAIDGGGAWAERLARLNLVRHGLSIGFLPLPLALVPLALALLLFSSAGRPLRRPIVAAWLAACLLFLAISVETGLVVRYAYFAAPLICLALGALLAALWPRPGGRAAVLALALIIFWAGAVIWVEGVLMRVKPSALPLVQ